MVGPCGLDAQFHAIPGEPKVEDLLRPSADGRGRHFGLIFHDEDVHGKLPSKLRSCSGATSR